MSRSRNAKWFRNAAIAVTIITVGWFFGPSGIVQGVEFSPDLFAHRSFRYYCWCGVQISFKDHSLWRSNIDKYLHRNEFITENAGHQPRWLFVKGFAPGIRGWHGRAKYYCQGVGCWDGNDRWVQWSEKNPNLAKALWPKVIVWARQGKYDEIFYLFRYVDLESAETTNDVELKIAEAVGLAGI